MKLTTLFLVISLESIAANGYSQAGNVTVNLKDSNLKEFFNTIEKQTSYKFLYRDDAVEGIKVNIDETDKPLENILNEIFNGSRFSYKLMPNNLFVIAPMDLLQQLKITGTVTGMDGIPLPGVNVVLKGSTVGAITDIGGKYSINTPDGNGIIVFSFIGFIDQEIAVNGRNTIDVKLSEEINTLSEVVVTALGIKREVRTLGYATDIVSNVELTVNRTPQTFGALQGKLSGVNITLPSTGAAGSTKIRIRGQSSFSGANSPLIVIDGMPMDNTQFTSRRTTSSDGGDGLSSINPDIIETMTVLKGAAASALYGSRAKDGVIMITTKKQGDKSGLGIEYNVNFTADQPLDFTDFQYEYGQGEGGLRPTTAWPTSGTWSFGEKFAPGMTQILFDNVEVPYVPIYNHIKKFYNVGKNLTNTIILSNRGEKGGFSASFTTTDVSGLVEKSKYIRRQLSIGFVQNISKTVTLDGSVNYSNENNINPPNVMNVYSLQIPLAVTTMANSMPLDLLKEYAYDSEGNELVWGRFLPRTNPYFTIDKKFENIKRDRLLGNMLIRYQPAKWLSIQGRIAQDFYVRDQDYNIPTGHLGTSAAPSGFVNGAYTQERNKFRESNMDFLINVTHGFGDININFNIGGNQMYRRSDYNSDGVTDFIQRGLYTIGNGRSKDAIYSLTERAVNSLYGTGEISFRNYLYFNITGRNDWFSTLSPENRSIFYPSFTSSFIFSDALKSFMPDWLSFGKLRLGYAQVGDDNVDAYSNVPYYSFNNSLFPNPLGQDVPIGSISSSQVPNPNLRPLRVSETEFGMELKLFENKIGLDLTYYYKLTQDQILAVQVSNASSYTNRLVNIGESMNKGIEMLLTATPVETSSFRWNVSFNFSYNNSKVLKLGLTAADTMISFGNLRYVVGKPIGSLYSYLYLRDADGNQVFDANSGKPLRTSEQQYVGDALPKYFGGITNSFAYKGIKLSALVDFRLGSKMIAGENQNYIRHGLHKMTLVGREDNYVIGVGVNPNGAINTTKCELQPFYETMNSLGINEDFIFPAGFWKLRQVSLGYDFYKYVSKITFIKGLALNVVANNVLIIKKWTENMDPENVANISDNSVGSSSWTALPPTRSIGFNLNIKF